MKNILNKKAVICIMLAVIVFAFSSVYALDYVTYTVKSGDSLWGVSQKFGLTVTNIKQLNGMTTDSLYIGQQLKLDPSVGYTVKSGDSLWAIANNFKVTVQDIRNVNTLANDEIYVGQVLLIPKGLAAAAGTTTTTTTPTTTSTSTGTQLQPVATVYHIIQSGDYLSVIARKYGTTAEKIAQYNYMTVNDWISVGQKLAINGYAPRNYTVSPGQDTAPKRVGHLVDWYKEGQYLLRRGDILTITDVVTGASFKVKMMGGYNHSDVETLTAADTAIMKQMFNNQWQWNPRAIVVYKNGMNIAASLSGMPHAQDTVSGNNMAGHCDVYLLNSKPHGSDVSGSYVQTHYEMIMKAAGR